MMSLPAAFMRLPKAAPVPAERALVTSFTLNAKASTGFKPVKVIAPLIDQDPAIRGPADARGRY